MPKTCSCIILGRKFLINAKKPEVNQDVVEKIAVKFIHEQNNSSNRSCSLPT